MSDVQEFPKMLYRKGNVNEQKIVNSQIQEDALGEDWVDAPLDPLAAPELAPAVPEKK